MSPQTSPETRETLICRCGDDIAWHVDETGPCTAPVDELESACDCTGMVPMAVPAGYEMPRVTSTGDLTQFLQRDPNGFGGVLLYLMAHADFPNMRRISLGFPMWVGIYEIWNETTTVEPTTGAMTCPTWSELDTAITSVYGPDWRDRLGRAE